DLVPRQLEEDRSLEWRVEERWRGGRGGGLDAEHSIVRVLAYDVLFDQIGVVTRKYDARPEPSLRRGFVDRNREVVVFGYQVVADHGTPLDVGRGDDRCRCFGGFGPTAFAVLRRRGVTGVFRVRHDAGRV